MDLVKIESLGLDTARHIWPDPGGLSPYPPSPFLYLVSRENCISFFSCFFFVKLKLNMYERDLNLGYYGCIGRVLFQLLTKIQTKQSVDSEGD